MTRKAETKLKDEVYNYLTKHVGGVWYKIAGSVFQQRGMPDIIGCTPKNGRFVGIELKSKVGKASTIQMYTLSKIRQFGGVALLFFEDELTEELKEKLIRLKTL